MIIKKLSIHDFEIFFNTFDNCNYLIIIFINSGTCCTSDVRKIKILKFHENKLFPINEFSSNIIYEPLNCRLFLFLEDSIFKKIFLITNIYDKLKIIDIFNFKKSFIYQYAQIDGFEQYLGDNGCIIQKKKIMIIYI